jgi:YVTN family beta-propeller protein
MRAMGWGDKCRAGLGWLLWAAAEVAQAQGAASAPPAAVAPATLAAPPLFVLNSLDATISVIDPVRQVEVQRLPTGKQPHHLYLSPDQRTLLVANALGNSLTLIDPRTAQIRGTINNIVDPYQLRFSPDMKWFVTAANRLNHVDLYRVEVGATPGSFGLTLAKRLPAGKTPSHLMIDRRSSVVYASLQDSSELMAIDLATQTTRWIVPVGKTPADVFLSRDDRTLLVALTGDSAVEAYDVSGAQPRLIKRIPTGDGAHAFRAWGDQRHVLVSNRAANTISRIDIDTLSVVDTYPGPGGPDCMDLSPDTHYIYLSSRWARKLSIIDTRTHQVIKQIPVGTSPHGVWTLAHAGLQ